MSRCECGAEIVQPARGRRRVKCEACSPTRDRPGRRAPVIELAARQDAAEAPVVDDSVAEQTRRALSAAARLDSWQGAAALKAARLLDAGQYTAQGAAALLKAHREALELAMEGAGTKADVIDLIFGEQA